MPHPGKPRTHPTRLVFIVGEAGHYSAAAASVPYAVLAYWFLAFPLFLYQFWYLPILLAIAVFLCAFASYGFWRIYRVKASVVALACGLIAVSFLLLTGVVASGRCGTPNLPCYRGIPALTSLL